MRESERRWDQEEEGRWDYLVSLSFMLLCGVTAILSYTCDIKHQ